MRECDGLTPPLCFGSPILVRRRERPSQAWLWVVLALVACRDLSIPSLPSTNPGTVQGQLAYAVVGRSTYAPAGNASIQLLGSGLSTTSDVDTGSFVLEGISQSTGQVLVTFDQNHDGRIDRQKLLSLSALKAGIGRDVALGQVILGMNASASGRALRGNITTTGGHAGTTVFVSNTPLATVTTDDGSFLLDQLPEGPVQLSFFRAGYGLETVNVTLEGGQEGRVAAVRLKEEPPDTAQRASLSGTIVSKDQQPVVNATVHAASNGFEATATTDGTGRFGLANLRPGLYQFAIEREGYESTKLTNIPCGAGEHELDPIVISKGTSSPVALDGGYLTLTTDAGNSLPDGGAIKTVNAVIAPAVAEAGPGTSVTLEATHSTGLRPLVYHWRLASPATEPPVFSSNDSVLASSTTFTAPATPQTFRIELTVTDALGVTSDPAVALVRVGVRPLAQLSLTEPFEVTSGSMVTLDGIESTSNDGKPIVTYEWAQLTGPVVSSISATVGPTLSFVAPQVAAPATLQLQLVVTNIEGLSSVPVVRTLIVRPAGRWSVRLDPQDSVYTDSPSNSFVTLTASVTGAPFDAGFTFEFSPRSELCDGGVADCVPFMLSLNLDGGSQAQLVLPHPVTAQWRRTFSVIATEVATKVQASASTSVTVNKVLDCGVLDVTTLGVRVTCTEPMADSGTFVVTDSVGAPIPGVTYFDPLRSSPAFRFTARPDGGLTHVDLSGVVNASGVAAPPSNVVAVPRLELSPHLRTTKSFGREPFPGWGLVAVSTQKPGALTLLGAAFDTSDGGITRSVWQAPLPSSQCGNLCPLNDVTSNGIPTAAAVVPMKSGTTVFNVQSRTYVAVSGQAPVSIMEWIPGNASWAELPVFSAPSPVVALASEGAALTLLKSAAAGLDWWTYDTQFNDKMELIPALVTQGIHYLPRSGGLATLFGIDANFGVHRFDRTASRAWTSVGLAAIQATDLRGVVFDNSKYDLVFTLDPVGTLGVHGFDDPVNTEYQVGLVATPVNPGNFDAAAWGNTAVVAYATSGQVWVGLYDRQSRTLVALPVDSGTMVWNSATFRTAPASSPRVTVLGDWIAVSWQESEGPNTWRMAGRLTR